MIFRNAKLILVPLLLLLATVVTVVATAIYEIEIKNQKASQLQIEADNLAESQDLSRAIHLTQKSASEDLADFQNLLLSSDKLVSLIEEIEKTGRALGLETEIVSVGQADGGKDAQSGTVTIAVETQGSWAPTLAFVRALESLPYRIMINESNLSKTNDSWHLRITLSLYLFN